MSWFTKIPEWWKANAHLRPIYYRVFRRVPKPKTTDDIVNTALDESGFDVKKLKGMHSLDEDRLIDWYLACEMATLIETWIRRQTGKSVYYSVETLASLFKDKTGIHLKQINHSVFLRFWRYTAYRLRKQPDVTKTKKVRKDREKKD